MSITEALGFIELMLAVIGASAILDKILSFRGQCEKKKNADVRRVCAGEKYNAEIENITKKYHMDHPAVRDGKPVPCVGLDCRDCDLNIPRYISCSEVYKEWLESEVDPHEEESNE